MTIPTQALISRVHDSNTASVLVRGRNAPLDAFDSVVTLDPGIIAVHDWNRTYLPLYVTAPAAGGRARKRFDSQAVLDIIEHVEQLLSEREFEGFWLRYHANLVNCLHERRVNRLEAQLAAIAAETDTTFVTWTDATTDANDEVYDEIHEEAVEL